MLFRSQNMLVGFEAEMAIPNLMTYDNDLDYVEPIMDKKNWVRRKNIKIPTDANWEEQLREWARGGVFRNGESVNSLIKVIRYRVKTYTLRNEMTAALKLKPVISELENLYATTYKRYRSKKDKMMLATYNDYLRDRKSTRLNSSHIPLSRMPSSA